MLGKYKKVVVTRGIIEITEYEKLNVKGGGARSGDGEFKSQNYAQTQKQRRRHIRQLVCMNFDSKDKFVTLTFDEQRDFDIRDVKACNHYFMVFVKRIKRKYPEFKYLTVVEFQDKNGRGAVHYHMICNLPYIKKSELQQIWGGGFVKINAIDKVDNVGAYVIKYMTADMDDERLCGLKAYSHSRGLVEPVEVCSWSDDPDYFRGTLDLVKEKTPSYFAEYESVNAGHVTYEQYVLARRVTELES